MSIAKKISMVGGALVVTLALAATTGFGQTTYITNTYQNGVNDYTNSVNDAWGRTLNSPGGDGDTWHGGEASMSASDYVNPHGDSMASYVSFENLGIPTNALIVGATLSLRTVDETWAVQDAEGDEPNGSVDLGVSGLLLKFDEGSATSNVAATNVVEGVTNVVPWNVALAQFRAAAYTFDATFDRGPDEVRVDISTSDINAWISWDVTDIFRAQFEADKADYGFVVHSNPLAGDHDGRVVFRTWEYNYNEGVAPFGTFSPKLEVVFIEDTMNLVVERSDDSGTTWEEVYSTPVPAGEETQDFRAVSYD